MAALPSTQPPDHSGRIVTLLPSATEIVCALGLRDQLVGVTHECDYPAGVETLPHVTSSTLDHNATSLEIDLAVRQQLDSSTSLYHLNEALLKELAPDLIVTQALCEVCAVAEDEVQSVIGRLPHPPQLVNLEPMTLTEVLDTISLVGQVADCPDAARDYRAGLERRIEAVRARTDGIPQDKRPRVGFLEWLHPLFNAGHWTPEIIEYAGGIDAFGNKHQPSQTLTDETLLVADPDVLVIALCGFDAARAASDLELFKGRIDYESLTAVKNDRVHLLDGNAFFSRPGPRLVDSLETLADMLHGT